MNPSNDPEIRRALAAGHKIEAIKRYRAITGSGLKEAKDAIEAMPAAFDPAHGGAPAASGGHDTVMSLIAAGRTIEAIKVYRAATGLGLAEAKAAVDQLAGRHAAGAPLGAATASPLRSFVERPGSGGSRLVLAILAIVVVAAVAGYLYAIG